MHVAHSNASFIPGRRATNMLTNAFQLLCTNLEHVAGLPSSVWLNVVHNLPKSHSMMHFPYTFPNDAKFNSILNIGNSILNKT